MLDRVHRKILRTIQGLPGNGRTNDRARRQALSTKQTEERLQLLGEAHDYLIHSLRSPHNAHLLVSIFGRVRVRKPLRTMCEYTEGCGAKTETRTAVYMVD